MDEVEVDPQLFVKCRLCLKHTGGMFQIVPKVRDQIKFCFDIEVKQFDGLPQLICKVCRTTLTEFYNTKMTFIENQKSLKSDITVKQELHVQKQDEQATPTTVCHSPQQTTVTSSQEIDVASGYIQNEAKESVTNEIDVERKENETLKAVPEMDVRQKEITTDELNPSDDDIKILKHRKKRSCLRLSSVSSEDVNQRRSASPLVKQKNINSENKFSWKCNFNKRLVCVLCQKHCKTRGNLTRHLTKHEKFFAEHADVFAKCCTVKMNKIDDKPNMTGTLSKVVYDPKKITGHGHKGNIPYYVVYSPKENKTLPPTISEHAESSEDDNVIKKRGSKRARLLSRSSNETVVLEKDSKASPVSDEKASKSKNILLETEPTECINIDDSSSDMDITSSEIDSTVKPKYTDYNKIQTIISICRNKYLKKIESVENDVQVETLLKHKILNMGRKVINKQGFNCTGLLRFMEHKNLDIIWNPTELSPMNNTNKDTNYVRIMPKLKGKAKLKSDKWNKILLTQEKGFKDQNVDNIVSVEEVNSTVTIGLPIIASSESTSNSIHEKLSDQAVLYAHSEIEINKNKLLNANPVANPKQLPKKINALENKVSNKKDVQNFIHAFEQPCSSEQENTELSMPIITSTTSLAAPPATEKEAVPNCSAVNEVEKSVPRIKVKPVSELMSERVLKNLTRTQIDFPSNIWNTNSEINDSTQQLTSYVPDATSADVSPASSAIPGIIQKVNHPQPTTAEYLILHTPELPNHKTEWPFKYLKELLYIHNIILLDPNEAIPKNFTCLIKFKLQYKQEHVAQPVILVITFACSGTTYHLGVKHSGQENIDLNQLPVNWQWEILNKIYQEEVVNKVLKNAQKINNATYECTKKFFCLLKSIQCKKVN